jgi:dCTP diphosphatase
LSDKEPSLAEIRERLLEFNRLRDWGQYHSPRNLAMALSVEASELLELYLWASDDGPQPPVEGRSRQVASEAADVAICLLNFCEHAGVDLLQAISDKIDRNAERYPVERAKGRLEKADEL